MDSALTGICDNRQNSAGVTTNNTNMFSPLVFAPSLFLVLPIAAGDGLVVVVCELCHAHSE